MFRHNDLLTILCLGILSLGAFGSLAFAQGDFSISLGSGIVADPGQEVALHFFRSSPDSIAGVDMLLEFDPDILTFSWVELPPRFQYASYDNLVPGRLRIVLRRHHSDSTYLPPLPPGTDILGFIWWEVTTQDLLTDLEAGVSFFEDPTTPFADNRLVRPDSSFVTPPELKLTHGGVLIRHPLYGDVNDDEYPYTIADAIFFFNFLAGSQELTPRQRANSDVNKDGVQASMADFIQLLRVIVEQ
ncbi:MAG: dockerin type I repeat-containing protein [candidate division Zixibacteria bacterium]|nr:dockerin type I repeat-containing protein [candidate division Zixibacteria bacterium]